MFAKIFGQIFDSSIARDYIVRHVFMDLLVLADRDGVVDMTPDAIARRTNVPEDIVTHAITALMQADKNSRSAEEDGARITLLDSHRDWGWQIVNYQHYRSIQDEESRRSYFRDKKREYRAKAKTVLDSSDKKEDSPHLSETVLDSPRQSENVRDCPTMSTQAEAEADAKKLSPQKPGLPPLPPAAATDPQAWPDAWNQNCGHLPRIRDFTLSRKRKVAARIRQGITVARFTEAVICCRDKPFLRGDGQRGWQASFDWLVLNDCNIEKAITDPYAVSNSDNGSPPPVVSKGPSAYEQDRERQFAAIAEARKAAGRA